MVEHDSGNQLTKLKDVLRAQTLGFDFPETTIVDPRSIGKTALPMAGMPVFARFVGPAGVRRFVLPRGPESEWVRKLERHANPGADEVLLLQPYIAFSAGLVVASRARCIYAEWAFGPPSNLLVEGYMAGACLFQDGVEVHRAGTRNDALSVALDQIRSKVTSWKSQALIEFGVAEEHLVALEAKPLDPRFLPEITSQQGLPMVGMLPLAPETDLVRLDRPALVHLAECVRAGSVVLDKGPLLSHLGTYSPDAYAVYRLRP